MAPGLSKTAVSYRLGTPAEHCGNCVMFVPGRGPANRLAGTGRCTLVKGVINKAMACDRWAGQAGRADEK